MCFPLFVSLPFARHTLHLLVFDFMAFHSSGVSLLTGQWFLPLSLAMLSMATLDGFLSNLGAFWRSKVHTSWRKKSKSSFPPCFLDNLWEANAHCITSLRKSFLYHLYDFLSTSKLSAVQLLINKIYTTHIVVVINNTCCFLYNIPICIHSVCILHSSSMWCTQNIYYFRLPSSTIPFSSILHNYYAIMLIECCLSLLQNCVL